MTSKKTYFAPAFIFIIIAIIYKTPFHIDIHTKHTLGYPKDSLLNFTELTSKYGYTSQEHTVVTDDGYLLKLFRIHGKNCLGATRKPPVILMHGLLQSSDVWLDAGPDAGLAYLLSDACHDLWVGNQRGNYYSRKHKHLNPDKDEQFWQFSVDEIGFYDIPAIIDYVLDYTGAEKVSYIGFSQGSGTFYVMCSERPEYCEKVQLLISLAPAARQTNTRSTAYRLFTKTINNLSGILSRFGFQEFLSKGSLSQEFMAFFCRFPMVSKTCDVLLGNILDSYHPGSITNKTAQELFGHFPAGTSLKNMVRYGQSMNSDNFQKFDYGVEENLQRYGSAGPPAYNLSAVDVPVVVLYGRNDYLVDVKDVKWLVSKLPNVLEAVEVEDPLWNHVDVTYSRYTNELIFPKIYEYLDKYSYKGGGVFN